MPFGFDGVFWRLMDVGIEWMIVVTQWVAALPGAIGRMAAFGTGPLVAATAASSLLGSARTPLRWSGAAVVGIAIVWSLAVHAAGYSGLRRRPQRRRARQGWPAAPHANRQGQFHGQEWLAADADGRAACRSRLAEGVHATTPAASLRWPGADVVALALRPKLWRMTARARTVIVTSWQAPDGLRRAGDRSGAGCDGKARGAAANSKGAQDGFAVNADQARRCRPSLVARGRATRSRRTPADRSGAPGRRDARGRRPPA